MKAENIIAAMITILVVVMLIQITIMLTTGSVNETKDDITQLDSLQAVSSYSTELIYDTLAGSYYVIIPWNYLDTCIYPLIIKYNGPTKIDVINRPWKLCPNQSGW